MSEHAPDMPARYTTADAAADTGYAGVAYRPPRAPEPEHTPVRRSLLMQALYDTFTRPGAKAGLAWSCVLAFLGVFAPFIANSHPVLMRTAADGKLSSPLIQSLYPVDVLLVVLFVGAVVLLVWRPLRFGHSLLVLLGLGVATFGVGKLVMSPSPNPVYELYREMEAAGETKWAVRTLVPYSPNDRLRDRPREILQPPSRVHWLGTTEFGEDLLSRMLYACRVALTIGIIATAISTVVGVIVGGVTGYFAGTTDLIGMRVIEIVEAIPRLILLLIITVFFGRSLYLMMAVIGLVTWTADARFVRAEFLKLRKLDFVQAAVAAGLPLRSIIFRHMLPNGIAPVLVNVSFGIAGAILLESTLSFLGLGLGAEDPSWGQLLNQARKGGTGFNWWIATFPGLAIFLTVFSYVLIGEAMRDALDPKLKKRD